MRARRDHQGSLGGRGTAAEAGLGARLVSAVVVAFALAGAALAQTTSSSLKGVVRTESGERVPDAWVEARSEATGVVRTASTDAQGGYRFELLSPGTWTVFARSAGGAASSRQRVTLKLQQTYELDLQLGQGMTETVTVNGEAPLVNRQRIGSELRVGGSQVSALPVAGRVVTDLALLDSSIQASPPGNYYGERAAVFTVNGQSGRANSFLVDGLDNNDQVSGTTLNASFSQQVIREFVVMTHQFAPEFGRASGGIMNIVTQRGENELSGELFLQGASSDWNRPGEFVSSLPDQRGGLDTSGRSETGFTFGGPFERDRAFYFLAYERQRAREVTPFTGVGRNGIAGGWLVAPARDDNLFLKTDLNLGPSNFLMVRLSGDNRATQGLNVGGNVTPEAGFDLAEKDVQLAASLTTVLSPDLLNETRALASGSDFDQIARSDRPGVDRPSGSFGGNNLNRQIRREDRVQLVDNVTWKAGSQTLKFGVDVTRSRTKIDVRFNPSGNFIYNTDAPFQPGDCGGVTPSEVPPARTDGTHPPIPCTDPGRDDDMDGTPNEPALIDTYPIVYTLIDGNPKTTLDDTRIAFFAQNSWQATPKLLIDYGWRYDLSTFRLPSSAIVRSRTPNGGAGRDEDNLAPRLGVAWTPGDSGRLVVRGGGGIFYDKLVLGFPALAAITSGTKIGFLFPQGYAYEITEKLVEALGVGAIREGIDFPREVTLFFSTGTKLDTPYTVQYALGTELAVGAHGVLSGDVVRTLGYHLVQMRDLNPPLSTSNGAPVRRDTTVGSIAAVVTEGRSWYSAVDLGWRWQGPSSVYSVRYTWSRALDTGFDPLKGGISFPVAHRLVPQGDPLPPALTLVRSEKARSDSDRRHRIVVSGESRFLLGLKVSGVLQAASGFPFNVTTGRDDNLDGVANDRPRGVDRNTGKDTPLGEVNRLRASAGLPAVQALREPSFVQLDLRLARPIELTKSARARAEIYVQVFNLFDRFNGGPVEGRAISTNFGRPVGQVGPPRTFDFGFRAGF